ncbi:membrane protein [soil metagenome]
MGTVFARNEVSPGSALVTGVTLFARRLSWYLRALGRNPLIRASDRLEAFAVLGVLATALFALPVAAQAGGQVYDAGVRTAEEQAQTRHSVKAVALEGSTSLPADFDNPAYVPAQWHEGSRLRTEQVIAPTEVTAGQPLTIWLDEAGKVVAAPQTAEDAELSAVAAAGTLWVVIVACSTLLALVIRRRLDRSRDRAWERELHLMAHNDDGWANRHI